MEHVLVTSWKTGELRWRHQLLNYDELSKRPLEGKWEQTRILRAVPACALAGMNGADDLDVVCADGVDPRRRMWLPNVPEHRSNARKLVTRFILAIAGVSTGHFVAALLRNSEEHRSLYGDLTPSGLMHWWTDFTSRPIRVECRHYEKACKAVAPGQVPREWAFLSGLGWHEFNSLVCFVRSESTLRVRIAYGWVPAVLEVRSRSDQLIKRMFVPLDNTYFVAEALRIASVCCTNLLSRLGLTVAVDRSEHMRSITCASCR